MKKAAVFLFLVFVWQWLRYASPRCLACRRGRMVPVFGTMRRLDGTTTRTICDCECR